MELKVGLLHGRLRIAQFSFFFILIEGHALVDRSDRPVQRGYQGTLSDITELFILSRFVDRLALDYLFLHVGVPLFFLQLGTVLVLIIYGFREIRS